MPISTQKGMKTNFNMLLGQYLKLYCRRDLQFWISSEMKTHHALLNVGIAFWKPETFGEDKAKVNQSQQHFHSMTCCYPLATFLYRKWITRNMII
ncbi:hypothetical protein Trydic_g20723 [Trypoxylus dichotomus]